MNFTHNSTGAPKSAVDGIEGVVDGHVRHRIQARLGRPWPFGGDACGDRRLARTCVPRRDRIRRCCRSRLSSAGRRTHGGGDERSHREHEQDPCEDMHDPPAFVNRRAPAPRGRLSALRRVSTRFQRSGRQPPGLMCSLTTLSPLRGESRGASPPRDGSNAIARSAFRHRGSSGGRPRRECRGRGSATPCANGRGAFAMARDASVLTVAGLATASDEDHGPPARDRFLPRFCIRGKRQRPVRYRLPWTLSRKCAKSDCGSNGGTSTPDFARLFGTKPTRRPLWATLGTVIPRLIDAPVCGSVCATASMQLSGAHGWGRSTGALLLPVEAVISGEPGRALARDEQRASRETDRTPLALPLPRARADWLPWRVRARAVGHVLLDRAIASNELVCLRYDR